MPDKCFFDTNIIVYSLLTNIDEKKNSLSKELILNQSHNSVISNQVINETINVLIKYNISNDKIKEISEIIFNSFDVFTINYSTIKIALDLRDKLNYSYYDLLILSTALETGCNILYSNDLQHDQIIGSKLRIINPFINIDWHENQNSRRMGSDRISWLDACIWGLVCVEEICVSLKVGAVSKVSKLHRVSFWRKPEYTFYGVSMESETSSDWQNVCFFNNQLDNLFKKILYYI